MNIGILGGSFDPFHNGHLYMAERARDACHLDEVWLVPAGHSPNKAEAGMTAAEHRFGMCEAAAAPFSWLSVSRIELDSSERSYTYRTLEKLSRQYPQHRFSFIMGGDSLDYFDTWKRPERIAELAALVAIPRGPHTYSSLCQKANELRERFLCDICVVSCESVAISSTEIRKALRERHQNAGFLPHGVWNYILENRLYEETGANEAWNEKQYKNI